MPRDRETTPNTATTQDGYDMPSSHVTDPDAGAKAAAIAVDREDPTPAQRWEHLFGKFLGDKLYEFVKREASAEDFMRLGTGALENVTRSLGKKLTEGAKGGSITDKLDAELIASSLQAELGPLAAAYMNTGPGHTLATGIASFIEGSPLAVISALLLAAAVAVASDMRVPELRAHLGIGGGFSAGVNAELGTFKHMMVRKLGADLSYAGNGWKAKVGVERDQGDAARDAINSVSGGPRLVAGAFDDHTVVTKLSASLDFQIRSITGSNLTISNTTLLQHGQSLSGNIGAMFTAPIGDKPDSRLGVGLTQGYGPHNAGTGVQFTMQINHNVMFKGSYNKDGAWAGVVIHIPL